MPASAWLLGWASLATQVVSLAQRGPANLPSAMVSVPLSVLVVGWFSYGVLRARMVRTWLAGILMGLVSLFGLLGLVVAPSPGVLAETATSLAAFGAFISYVCSDCFGRYRAEPDRAGPDLAGPVTLAVIVGVLGGLTAADAAAVDGRSGFHVRVGL